MIGTPTLGSALGTIATLTFQEALRDKVVRASVLMIGTGWVVILFLGELLLTNPEGSQAGMLAFFLRLGCVFQVAILVAFAVARDLQNRGLELLLALPFPRAVVFMGKWLGFALVVVLLALVCGLALLPLVPAEQVLLWGLVLACELLLVAGVALVLTLTLQQAPLALTLVAGFYLLARLMPTLLLIVHQTREMSPHWSATGAEFILTVIVTLLPGLDHFVVTEWLVYQTGSLQAFWPILGETVIYLLLLLSMGLFDLYRRDF